MKRLSTIIELNTTERIPTYKLAVMLHGFMMELLSEEAAIRLHEQELNPYSQSVRLVHDGLIWEINFLTDELFQEINNQITQFLDQPIIFSGIQGLEGYIKSLQIIDYPLTNLSDVFYREQPQQMLNLHFYTPTAFKQQNEYIMFPDMRLIIQNLMLKYNFIIEGHKKIDQEFLQELTDSVQISRYKLQSRHFRIHGHGIPGFTGSLTIRIRGNDTIKSYLKMLFTFAQFSGVGIKTAMGMGKVEMQPINKH